VRVTAALGQFLPRRFKNGVADPPPITAALARNVRDRDGPLASLRTTEKRRGFSPLEHREIGHRPPILGVLFFLILQGS
jgi:hypothetical protein